MGTTFEERQAGENLQDAGFRQSGSLTAGRLENSVTVSRTLP